MLYEMTIPSTNESITKAGYLYHSLKQSEFLMSLIVCKKLIAYTRGLTIKLQSRNLEVYEAYKSIKVVKITMQKVRDEIDVYHKEWFDTAVHLAQKLRTEIRYPRICGRQTGWSNVPASSTEVYFRTNLSIPFLDHILLELTSRFAGGQEHICNGTVVIPSRMLYDSKWKEKFALFTNFYKTDLSSEHALNSELDLWEEWWKLKGEIPDTAQQTIILIDRNFFPNIITVLKILCTLPITTCEYERSVSVLTRLKTYSRTTMAQDRLNGLALMHIHYELDIEVDKVLDMFVQKHQRRLTLYQFLILVYYCT